MTVELRRYCIRTAEPLVPRQAAIPENLTFQLFAQPRTGTTIESLQSVVLSRNLQSESVVRVVSQSRQSESPVRAAGSDRGPLALLVHRKGQMIAKRPV